MTANLLKLSLLGIICRQLYITTAVSNDQSSAIVGGSIANLGQFPHHVLLRRDPRDLLFCGGSIISDKWVLTAAHCVYNRTYLHMEFGTTNLHVKGVTMNSSKFYIHPKYQPDTLMNDVALIKLPSVLKFNESINYIQLVPTKNVENEFEGKLGFVTGFGWSADQANKYTEYLLRGTVKVIGNKECARKLTEYSIQASRMCTVPYKGTNMSPCKGDTGGALVWESEYVQIGIISTIKQNHCSEYPVIYARISSYIDYIRNITGLEFH
ncbi:collagenase-like [Lucilia sericata]|uniref:collagenase-like n=1 Tax=Lucilia sericata TaxID=13632 RepID=UPI0018A80FD4|nr:collagenase-like [Lucilia sericata]